MGRKPTSCKNLTYGLGSWFLPSICGGRVSQHSGNLHLSGSCLIFLSTETMLHENEPADLAKIVWNQFLIYFVFVSFPFMILRMESINSGIVTILLILSHINIKMYVCYSDNVMSLLPVCTPIPLLSSSSPLHICLCMKFMFFSILHNQLFYK